MSTITLTRNYGYESYRIDGLAAGTVIDASAASWVQDNDAGDGNSNPYPFAVYNAPGAVLQGGTIRGNINQTDAWRAVYDEGNSAGVRTEDTPNVVIRDWRISDTWDAIRVSWNSPGFLIEDVWATNVRDDAVENDRLQSGTIRDSLFDGAFGGLSIDPSSSSPVDGHTETVLIDGVLLRLQPSLYEGEMTHSALIKTDSATNGTVTPNLRFTNNVFAIEDVNHHSYRSMFDAWDNTIESRNNVFLNLSDDPLPRDYPMPPAGWTVLEGQKARDYWETARDAWIARHADGAGGSPAGSGAVPRNDGVFLEGKESDDKLTGSSNDDKLFGHVGNDTLHGNGGDDTLVGGDGNDRLDGGDGNDALRGGRGNDTLYGNTGNDMLSGNAGNDMLVGNGGNDRQYGGGGNDLLYGNAGADRLHGNSGNDLLKGGDGNDYLSGGDGRDILYGNNGNDILNGNRGDDTLIGGGGSDRFIFSTTSGSDVIVDFQDNLDRLTLDDDLWGGGKTIAQVIATYATAESGNTVFDFGGGDILTIEGISNPGDLANDILFS